MAITALEYLVFSTLRARNLLPAGMRVLELGESNWYGDVPIDQFEQDIRKYVNDPAECEALIAKLRESVNAMRPNYLYEIAAIFWRAIINPVSYSAIDPGTPGSKYRFDLNQPVPLQERFDLTINIGTAEHIFNVQQFFKTADERTVEGGLMVHSSPFTGWPDHGFYNFQPTFFYDLARANGYAVLGMVIGQLDPFQCAEVANHDQIPQLIKSGQLPRSSHICVVFRKSPTPRPFAVPIQAYYANALSPAHRQAWHELR